MGYLKNKDIGVVIDKEYCQMTARYLKTEMYNSPTKAKLIFQKMTNGSSGKVKICEDQYLYKVRIAKKGDKMVGGEMQ
jgi:hypothetical protein